MEMDRIIDELADRTEDIYLAMLDTRDAIAAVLKSIENELNDRSIDAAPEYVAKDVLKLTTELQHLYDSYECHQAIYVNNSATYRRVLKFTKQL